MRLQVDVHIIESGVLCLIPPKTRCHKESWRVERSVEWTHCNLLFSPLACLLLMNVASRCRYQRRWRACVRKRADSV